jgi:hypothetical protein
MRNNYDDEDDHDYSPNELANLSVRHREKYEQIVKSNLDDGDTIENWQQRNLAWAKKCLEDQRRNHR